MTVECVKLIYFNVERFFIYYTFVFQMHILSNLYYLFEIKCQKFDQNSGTVKKCFTFQFRLAFSFPVNYIFNEHLDFIHI